MALYRLDGQKLIYLNFNPNTSATQLGFDLGAKLHIRRMRIQNDGDVWSLYKPDHYVLSVRGDGKYHYDLGDITPDKYVLKPIVME